MIKTYLEGSNNKTKAEIKDNKNLKKNKDEHLN